MRRVLRRVLEYVWFPFFLTVCVYIAAKSGVLDTEWGQVFAGWMIMGFIIWRICGFTLSQTAGRRLYLILAFFWCIGSLANTASDPTPRSVNREVLIACLPLALGVKYMQISRDLQRD